MGLLGHLARPLTPKSGAKAIVFLGRDNGLPWNAALDVRVGSSLCENSYVELARRNFVLITLNRKRTTLAVAVERGKGRKQFCAFSARARFQWMRSARAARCEGTEMGHPVGPLLAALKNLAHSASFHSMEKTAPSNPGIKHLVRDRRLGW